MNFLSVIFSVYLFFHNLSITVAVIIWCLGQTAWSCIECWFSPNPFPAKMTWRWRSPWRQPCWSAWLGRGASWPTSGTAHWPKTLTNSPWPWKVNVCTQQFLQSAALLSSFYLLFCCSFLFVLFFLCCQDQVIYVITFASSSFSWPFTSEALVWSLVWLRSKHTKGSKECCLLGQNTTCEFSG